MDGDTGFVPETMELMKIYDIDSDEEKEKSDVQIGDDRLCVLPFHADGPGFEESINFEFEEASLSQTLLENLKKLNYGRPYAVQQVAIPYILKGYDVACYSPISSGKTAAYVVPLLQRMLDMNDITLNHLTKLRKKRRTNKKLSTVEPRVVIIGPNAGSVLQIESDLVKLSHGMTTKVRSAFEGTSNFHEQLKALQTGCNIFVATPGRLLMLIKNDYVCLRKVKYLILDSTDWLQAAFNEQIQEILLHGGLPPKSDRQNMIFSVTFMDGVRSLADDFLVDHMLIGVGDDGASKKSVSQEIFQVKADFKFAKLIDILNREFYGEKSCGDSAKRVLLYIGTKLETKKIYSDLLVCGFPITVLTSDMEKSKSDETVTKFKTDGGILAVSSGASKNLNVYDVDVVINYDMPREIIDYVRRIARVGPKGRAVAFFDRSHDRKLAKPLIEVLKMSAGQQIPAWLVRLAGAERNSE